MLKDKFEKIKSYILQNFLYEDQKSKYFKESNVGTFLLIFSSTILCFFFCLLIFSALFFIIGLSINIFIFYASILVSSFWLFRESKKLYPSKLIVVVIAQLLLIILTFSFSLLIGSRFIDISYDGQAYQSQAVMQLSNNWNPFYKEYSQEEIPFLAKWIDSYPKTTWIIDANIYKITNNFESIKLINVVFLIVCFTSLLGLLLSLKRLKWYFSVIISTVVVLNPVITAQLFSNYLDGVLACLFSIIIFYLVFTYLFNKSRYLPIIFFASILFINTKFTSLVYFVLFFISFIILSHFQDKILLAKRLFLFLIVALIVGVGIIGFNPYMTNTFIHGNPFYPVYGKGTSFVPTNLPPNMVNKNSIELLYISNFSESNVYVNQNKAPVLKIPLTYSEKELNPFPVNDMKIGGFGPLFGGILILVVIFLVILSFIKSQRKIFILGIFITLLIIITCVVNSLSYVARYIPQLWLLPLIPIIIGFIGKSKLLLYFSCILAAILIYNSIIFTNAYVSYNLNATEKVYNKMQNLSDRYDGKILKIYFGEFFSNKILLEKYNINYTEVKDIKDCTKPKVIFIDSVARECS